MALIISFSLCVYICDALRFPASGVFHNPLLLFLGPWMIILSLCLIFTYCSLNSAMHTSSYSFPIETSELCVRLGMILTSHYSSGKAGKSGSHGLLDCMVWPFGNPI